MPKYGEKTRKIKKILSGDNVRYPKKWELKMIPILEKQYPTYDSVELHQVLGGIWNNYNSETKIKIINEYQTHNTKINLKHSNEIGERFLNVFNHGLTP
jgi:hypothetical protein